MRTDPRRPGPARVWLERALLATGFICLGWFGLVTLDAEIFQREQAAAFERLRETPAVPPPPLEARVPSEEPDSPLVGLLDIPRLAFSTPVIVGDDDRTLRVAAGLLPDTPRPWEPGNSAIAAHRDGLFRPLRHIRIGDQIVMRTTRGDFRYAVADTRIVLPDDLSVLAPTPARTLTLITCYPFDFVGSAPKRFIVQATRVDDRPRVEVGKAAAEERRERKPLATNAAAEERSTRSTVRSRGASEKRTVRRAQTSRASSKASKPNPRRTLEASGGKEKKPRNVFRRIGSFFKKLNADNAPDRPRR